MAREGGESLSDHQTTEAGRRQLAEVADGLSWDGLADIYAPLALVPTPVHRALIELILAAVVARQHEIRPDRHPFFVAFGSTLRWKTSAGRFVCHTLGLDPAVQVVDCGSEVGRSLTFRRGGDGSLVSRRALLESPFLVLDEFQTAGRSVRTTLSILLSGRLVTPVENEQLTVRPVPLLTLNPGEAKTLEGRLGLSAPLIRRALLVNLDAVPVPDLATAGERAIEAAKTHGPLTLGSPQDDLKGFHDAIVALVRNVFAREAHERVDVEIVVNLAVGMTAFIPDPVPAIAQVAHGVGLIAETLGWARPGWIEAVSDFRRGPTIQPPGTSALARRVPSEPSETNTGQASAVSPTPGPISLVVPPPPARRHTPVPDLDLSDELRARLIWFAVDTGQSVEEALTTLLDVYVRWRNAKRTIETLAAILRLGDQLDLAQVDVEELDDYLKARETLRHADCDIDDVPEALRVITLLQEALPVGWTWDDADVALQGIVAILEAGLSLEDVKEFLEWHHRLEALAFDEATAVAVAEALTRAGASGDRRDAVLETLVDVAGKQLDVEALAEERARLEAAVTRLRAAEQRWKTRIKNDGDKILEIRRTAAQLNETIIRLRAECDKAAGAVATAKALQAFLVEGTAEAEPLWASLEVLLTWRKRGDRIDGAFGQMLTNDVRRQIVEFFRKLLQDLETP